MNLTSQLASAQEILQRAIKDHQPTHVFAMYSGGHDSLISTAVAKALIEVDAAVHINTTIGIEETREHVRASAPRLGLPLIELFPPQSYRDMCIEHGMPGPGAHLYCYTRLKQRCVEQLVREHKRGRHDRIMLITGVRRQESRRRMGNVADIQRTGAQVWVAPCIEWNSEEKEAYIDALDLPRNPVVQTIGMSGECLCGSFASPGELDIVAEHFPKTLAAIKAIQDACAARGVHAQWGVRPPKVDRHTLPLCFNCAPQEQPA